MSDKQVEAAYNEKMAQLREASRLMRQQFELLMATVKLYKPGDRSETDRNYAILITELQKAYAFYKTYLHVPEV